MLLLLLLISSIIAVPINDNNKLFIEAQMPLFNLTSEYFIIGKTVGPVLKYIVLYENSFCFVTRSKAITNTERCRVTYNYNTDTILWWTAEFISNNDNYECGIRCVTMNS